MSSPRGRELVSLTRPECLALLSACEFGRVVVATARDQTPLIRPVGYGFDDASQSVVFRTVVGSKFHALMHSARACFEIDGADQDSRTGWSVIVSGVAEELSDPGELRRVEQLGIQTWLGTEGTHWVRIRARTVSGRRIAPSDGSG